MTQIGGYIAPTRRAGVLGVHSLDHFSMTVPDLAAAKRFYESFGLDVRPEGNLLALYTHADAHRWGVLHEGPYRKLHYLCFGAFEDDLPKFRDHLARLGIERMPPPAGFESNGLWFLNHDGVPIEIRVAEKSSPNAKGVFKTESAPAAPSRASCALHIGRYAGHRVLFEGIGPALVRLVGRPRRLHAWRPRQRSSSDCARPLGRARSAPLQLGRWRH